MIGISKEDLESSRPNIDVLSGINFCLNAFYEDKTHYVSEDCIAGRLSYEELIGVLLLARDYVTLLENNE